MLKLAIFFLVVCDVMLKLLAFIFGNSYFYIVTILLVHYFLSTKTKSLSKCNKSSICDRFRFHKVATGPSVDTNKFPKFSKQVLWEKSANNCTNLNELLKIKSYNIFNLFIHNVEKWLNILQYVWPFCNIMKERVKILGSA